MAVPRHRHTVSKVHKRRMHIFIKPASLVACSKCKKATRPYTACQFCGYYKGKEVINVLGKLTKKERKAKQKEMQEVEKEDKGKNPLAMEELSKK